MQEEIIDSVAIENLSALTTDALEIGLDTVLDSGLIKDIPVFGSLVKLYNIGSTIKDRIFERKLLKFLNHLSDIQIDKRLDFIKKIEKSPNKKKHTGEILLVLLYNINVII